VRAWPGRPRARPTQIRGAHVAFTVRDLLATRRANERASLLSGRYSKAQEACWTNQNAVPHDSHRCAHVIIRSLATTTPASLISSLWQLGHRRSWLIGNSGSGARTAGLPIWTSISILQKNCSPLLGLATLAPEGQNPCRPCVPNLANLVDERCRSLLLVPHAANSHTAPGIPDAGAFTQETI
jgi:hypothetical protein